ncbi:MAG TPA: hypothetical protein VF920_08095 [Dongiaceae bacterium]
MQRLIALALLATGLGLSLGSHVASAVTIEDSAGNPDAIAPLTDPDDAAGDSAQSGGFSIIAPDQSNNGTGLQWTFGTQTMPGSMGDGQTQ